MRKNIKKGPFCKYHNVWGHHTNDCITLRDNVEVEACKGCLDTLVPEKAEASKPANDVELSLKWQAEEMQQFNKGKGTYCTFVVEKAEASKPTNDVELAFKWQVEEMQQLNKGKDTYCNVSPQEVDAPAHPYEEADFYIDPLEFHRKVLREKGLLPHDDTPKDKLAGGKDVVATTKAA